jgi:hypothetical protein
MIISIHQPHYLPWLGYIDKIDRADTFVVLDNVQYKKNDWINRNKIKTAQGSQWLTVPVTYHHPEKINQVKIDNKTSWGKKHLHALITNYSKSSAFEEHLPFFDDLYSRKWEYLSELNIHIIHYIIKVFGIKTQVVMASHFELREESTERLVDICRQLKGDIYLPGSHGQYYMDTEKFEKENIKIITQDFKHPVYQQLYGDFLPHMSFVDILFNHGSQGIEIIRKENHH